MKIQSQAPLPDQFSLEGLGQINLICGRNNSGKSTLLRAIGQPHPATAPVSYTFSGETLRRFQDVLARKAPWKDRAEAGSWSGDLLAEVEARTKKLDDDGCGRRHVNYLVGELYQWLRQTERVAPNDRDWLVQAFNEALTWSPRPLVIPLGRNLDSRTKISHDATARPDGDGVLNALFMAKNQTPGSRESHDFNRLVGAFETISEGYTPWIQPLAGGSLELKFAKAPSRWDPADACGHGLRDLLVMLYSIVMTDHTLICIEEPESHMHPEMQRRLVSFMREQTHKQYFLATHSNVFLGSGVADSVFLTTYNAGVTITPVTSQAHALSEMGYTVADNIVADMVILVEGPGDTVVLPTLLRMFTGERSSIVKFWALGGDIMDKQDLSVFVERHKVRAIVDSDPGSGATRKRFLETCRRLGIPAHQLERYAIENYFPLRVLREVFRSQIPADLQQIDPMIRLEDQIGLDPKARSNLSKLARATRHADIADTDLGQILQTIAAELGK
ncbi:MAG: AAA family ATPase [Thermoanaerobaculia bacterium]|nr:AAA family ATPase [Thermoanaerobaculia bacterium]